MKQKLIFFFLLTFLFSGCYTKTTEEQERVYKMALEHKNYLAAIQAVYNIIAIKPELTQWNDTLLNLYKSQGAYLQISILAEKRFQTNPSDVANAELLAVAYEGIGETTKAIEVYDLLFETKQDLTYWYRIAVLQFKAQWYDKCLETLSRIIGNNKASEVVVTIDYANEQQDVLLKAVAHNIRGVIYKQQNQTEKAKIEFETALNIFPEFILAQENLKTF